MKMFRKDEGFTLIELMVVVLIIGILVAIAIPVFTSARANAQKRSCFANQRTLDGAAHSYESSQGALPAATLGNAANHIDVLESTLVPSFIATPPACPNDPDSPKTMAGSYDWRVDSTGRGTISCQITHGVYQ